MPTKGEALGRMEDALKRLKFDRVPPGLTTPRGVKLYARRQRGQWARKKWNEVVLKVRGRG